MLARMIGAARLDLKTFREVTADENATPQAIAVVIISAMAIGFGVGPGYAIPISFILWWVSWWAIWVFLVYLIGPMVLQPSERAADWGRFARATGFSQSPALGMVLLTFIHGLGPSISLLVFLVVATWWFLALVVGVRQALEISTMWAFAVAGTFLIPSIVIELGLF